LHRGEALVHLVRLVTKLVCLWSQAHLHAGAAELLSVLVLLLELLLVLLLVELLLVLLPLLFLGEILTEVVLVELVLIIHVVYFK